MALNFLEAIIDVAKDIPGQVGKTAPRRDRSAFGYMAANPSIPDFAQCSSCQVWIKDRERCLWLGNDQPVLKGDSCILYVQGDPIEGDVDALGSLTEDEVGFFRGDVRCENCVSASDDARHCFLYEKLNEAFPDLFLLNEVVEPKACCNAFASDSRGVVKDYNPGEARDERGRWTGGGSDHAGARARSDAKQLRDAEARVADLQRQLHEHSQDHSEDIYWGIHHALQQAREDVASLKDRIAVAATKAFNPDEPRDERGMWTAEGGGISSETASKISSAADISGHLEKVEDAKMALDSASTVAEDAEQEAQGHFDEHGVEDPELESAAVDAQQSAAEAAVKLHEKLSLLNAKTAAAMARIEQHLAASGITRVK